MEDIKQNRYLLKGSSYILDLYKVDFITWKENEKVEETYWAKLHMGSKEARYICDNKTELRELILAWTNIQGEEIEVTEEELVKEW
tara:strand:- start:962 stop:1219 length:258 start_codon:yes stop_codon:yes gene_type:complete